MTRHLYALLVGINQYDARSRVPPLRGCINDIRGMQAYLEGRVAQDEFVLELRTLTNEAATRQAIIDGFRQHLAQAGPEDVALFYYAGHGAQSLAPQAFWPMEPDRMMETLVCYDSRTDDDHWDLADKELAQLIAEVDRQHPHIVVILDCCHSGSGTREGEEAAIATRRAKPDRRPRPLDSLIVSPEAVQSLVGQTRSLNPVAMQLPVGRHVVLSACRDIEEAKEYHGAGEPRGAFSYFLQQTLAEAKGALSYRDLFKRTNALIRTTVPAQSPQLDAPQAQDMEQPFLGGAIAPVSPYFTVSCHRDYGWVIDGGAIHGLRPPQGDETTVLALFPLESSAEQLKQAGEAIAQVRVTRVLPQLSQIDSNHGIFSDPNLTFKAVVIRSPLPPLAVLLEGDESGLAWVRQAIATADSSGQPSLYVCATDQMNGAVYRLLARDNCYWITSTIDERPLVTAVEGYSPAQATKVVQTLEHMARWKTIAELASPASSRIRGTVELKVYSGDEADFEQSHEITAAQIRLSYTYDELRQTWQKPRFRLKIHNNSNQTLYCALFYLTEQFAAQALPIDTVGRGLWLLPDQEVWVRNGAALTGTVKDELWHQGITEIQDLLKLVACTDEFDPTLLNLDALGVPKHSTDAMTTRSAARPTGLNRLMQRTTTRDIGFADEVETYDDWVTQQLSFSFVRPQLSTTIHATEAIALGSGVTLQPHPSLQAQAKLTTVPQSTRDLRSCILPSLLQEETQPFLFTQSRNSDPGLSALELSQVEHPEAVTPQQPLVLEAEMSLEGNEWVLPIAYDGEFYLPLGYGKTVENTTGNRHTKIVIERLTDPLSEGNRSVQGSIRIFFQKVISRKLGEGLSKKLGITFEYPLLAIAQLIDGTVVYNHDPNIIQTKVAEAQTIALYIHGIFGDTEVMVPSIATARVDVEGDLKPLSEVYDLVLAFDYENLNTTIDRNARALKQRLHAVGLGENHGKTLHIIAHSMGGLVSRWLIEQEGGNAIIQHLIMLGTPNGGSPWPEVQAGITTAVAFAINGLSLGFPPLKILSGLLERIETVDVSLDQMQPGSDFLAEMAMAKDPGVPYSIVVGNTSLIMDDPSADLKAKLKQKLGKLVEIPFFDQPNDIAVSVESIEAVPGGRSPAPHLLPAACNHLVYFTDPAGLTALAEAVAVTGITPGRSHPPQPPSNSSQPVGPESSGSDRDPSPNQSNDASHNRQWVVWVGSIVGFLLIGLLALNLLKKSAPQPSAEPSSRQSLAIAVTFQDEHLQNSQILETNKPMRSLKAHQKQQSPDIARALGDGRYWI